MRHIILAMALLCPAAAFAQGTTSQTTSPTTQPTDAAKPGAAQAPMVGDTPLVQVGKKPAAKKSERTASGKPLSVAQKLQICQDIDDGTKDRLNCYDEIYKPQPKAKAASAEGVGDCHFVKEEDERLACYNGFADKIPLLPR